LVVAAVTPMLRRRIWLTIPEAHALSGIPAKTLARQCRDGKRRCRKVGHGRGRWQVPASDFRKVQVGIEGSEEVRT
jgi:hypothetical protein